MVQKKFTKPISNISDLNYNDPLQSLKLQSLEHRRLICDLVLCYKIVHNNLCMTFTDLFKFPNITSPRRHSLQLYCPVLKSNLHKGSFAYRVISPWNSLPENIVCAPNSVTFKIRLSKFDLSKFLILPCIVKKFTPVNILKNCFKTVFFLFFFLFFLFVSYCLVLCCISVFLNFVFLSCILFFYSDKCVLHVCDSCYGICMQNIFIISYRLLVIIISWTLQFKRTDLEITRPGLSAFCPAGSYQHCDPIQICLSSYFVKLNDDEIIK